MRAVVLGFAVLACLGCGEKFDANFSIQPGSTVSVREPVIFNDASQPVVAFRATYYINDAMGGPFKGPPGLILHEGFAAPGEYTIRMEAESHAGTQSSATKTLTVLASTDPVTFSCSGRTLTTTPVDLGVFGWGCDGVVTGATSTSEGAANTTAIVAGACSVATPGSSDSGAAAACAEYVGLGFDDWYLPSSEEFACLKGTPTSGSMSVQASEDYWTSTEVDDANALRHNFATSTSATGDSKRNFRYVRCVRG